MHRVITRACVLARSRTTTTTEIQRFLSASTSRWSNDDIQTTSLSWDRVVKTEGPSWVAILPETMITLPREQARKLRWAGRAQQAHRLLRESGAHQSRDEADLIELLLVMSESKEYKDSRKRLEAMVDTLWNAPSGKPRAAFNILLSACAREATRVSHNSTIRRDFILRKAELIWNEFLQSISNPGSRAIATMYRICGDCKNLHLAEHVRNQVDDPVVRFGIADDDIYITPRRSSEEATAAYILCLGKCNRASEAEQLYFSKENNQHRTSNKVLAALFQAHAVSNKISKAESLISTFGARFLTTHSCNTFVKQCASLRLLDTAVDFVEKMSRSEETGFPLPSAKTYNLLLRGLSAGTGAEDRSVAADRALLIVNAMKEQGIEPTTVTYNTLIRSLAFRNQIDEALKLYHSMRSPNRITFSHLMQGAANISDMNLASDVLSMLIQSRERPNYGFCKSYLEIVATTKGIEAVFQEARNLAAKFGEILVFGDVGSQEAIRMALIKACGKVGELDKAFDALSFDLKTQTKDTGDLAPLYVATVLMQVCLECNSHGKALEVFQSLKDCGIQPNFEVYESLIYGLSSYVRSVLQREMNDNYNESMESLDSFENEETQHDVSKLQHEQRFSEEYGVRNKELEHTHKSTMFPVQHNTQNPDGPGPLETFEIAVQLLREMHLAGVARSHRKATYVYNTLIAAAASVGDFELALQVFNKMSRRNNYGVVYISRNENTRNIEEKNESKLSFPITTSMKLNGYDEKDKTSLVEEIFDIEVDFPAATVGTYNSFIAAAWQCGQAKYSFGVFDLMQIDRITEPNSATLSLLADIALADAQQVPMEAMQRLLKALDRVKILSMEVCEKRVQLRQKMLALRWS